MSNYIGENIWNKNKFILGFLCVLLELSSFEKVKFLIRVNDSNLIYQLSKKGKAWNLTFSSITTQGVSGKQEMLLLFSNIAWLNADILQ